MTPRRLALLLAAFFVALALPTTILVYQAYGQLKWEAFHQHQRLARELALRIDAGFREVIAREESRPIGDYEFMSVNGTAGGTIPQRSPLSKFPPVSDLPGLLGYFQVDAAGRLRTPIVPADDASRYGISRLELRQRRAREAEIRGILDRNRLVGKSGPAASAPALQAESAPASAGNMPEAEKMLPMKQPSVDEPAISQGLREAQGQAAFDELSSRQQSASSGKVEDLQLEDRFDVAADAASAPLAAEEYRAEVARPRKEETNPPQTPPAASAAGGRGADEADAAAPLGQQRPGRIEAFAGEVDPMEFALLDSGHFVLFRRVWHEGERQVQGLLIDQRRFLGQLIEPAFRQSSVSSMSRLIVAYRGAILENLAADYSRQYQPSTGGASNELLYQSRMIAPFGDIELIFTLARLPLGAGGKIILWSALVLSLVLIGGFFLLYQLGLRQLALARQQQDFVSAVSHELKTPLTSIRMYGEMLREGWADETRRQAYYDFIFHEAERLTRLINNVLQLARMSRNEQQASLAEISVAEALEMLKPRLESQLEPSGFELEVAGDGHALDARMRIDADWFIQIFTNLVDNAVKFSAGAETRRIGIGYRKLSDGRIQFSVRDYGPGIAPDQMKKIFRLFYRSENELTRETVGTGIGLALVQQLAGAMAAEIDVVNRDPGAEFRLFFPTVQPGSAGSASQR